MTREELMYCSCTDITDCNPEHLVDLKRVDIAADLPVPMRMVDYMNQIQNPYLFRIDKLTVKVSFTGTQELLSALSGMALQS